MYKEIKEMVKPKMYRGLPTTYELRDIDIEERNGKMEAIIFLVGVLKTFTFSKSLAFLEKQEPFNIKKYNEALSNAKSYYQKEDMISGIYMEILRVLLNDINIELPKKPNWEIFKSILKQERLKGEIRDFDSFFEGSLTNEEKEMLKKREEEGLTGARDIDWLKINYKVNTPDRGDFIISERADVMKLKNEDINHIIGEKQIILNNELLYIYNNIDKLKGRLKKPTLNTLIIAALFNQKYDIYPVLKTSFDYIEEIKEKE